MKDYLGYRVLAIFLALVLIAGVPSTMMAQKKGGRNNKTAKKTSSSKKSSTNSKTASKRVFEGVLMYRNYEYHSSVVRKFSYGSAYNGERSVKVLIKGNKIHITDESLHLHTIILPDAGVGYIYSDVAKEGIKANLSFLDDYLRTLDPNYSTKHLQEKKTSTLSTTQQTVEWRGDRCKVYKGYLMRSEDAKTDVEMWYSEKFRVPACYGYVFSGLNPGGIIRKGVYNNSGKIPLLGNIKSLVSTELVALTCRQVAPSEMMPPPDVVITEATENKQLTALYKKNRAQLKKKKLTPKPLHTKEVKYNLNSQWDFAEEWINYYYDSGRKDDSWQKIGDALFDLASFISSAGTKEQPASNNDIAENTDGEIPIDYFIYRLQSEYNDMEDQLSRYERDNQQRLASAKTKKVKVGSKYVEMHEKAPSKMSKKMAPDNMAYDKISASQLKAVMKVWEKKIKHLERMRAHGTEFLTEKQFGEMSHDYAERDRENYREQLRLITNQSIERSKRLADSFAESSYRTIESILTTWYDYPLNHNFTREDVLEYQKKMREIRKNTPQIQKSKIEDWDGTIVFVP